MYRGSSKLIESSFPLPPEGSLGPTTETRKEPKTKNKIHRTMKYTEAKQTTILVSKWSPCFVGAQDNHYSVKKTTKQQIDTKSTMSRYIINDS